MKKKRKSKFLLLQVITPHYHQDIAISNMKESAQLVETYGGDVIVRSVQHRVKPYPDRYIGSGKVEWLKQTVKEKKIDVVVLNDIVNSGQLFRLERTLWEVNPQISVWDRIDLILNIFDQHATTTEAKLQIELARIQHSGPRIHGLGRTELSRQGGGIGTRGLGETNIEIERRNIKKRTQKIKQQLEQRTKEQQKRIQQRKQLGLRTVALVGYTSAGKTTLFNALTAKNREAHQKLFTTLDSVVGKLEPDKDRKLLISDTVGFIDKLPPVLIDAFRSTLFESASAELLFHVIDVGDEKMEDKIKVVERILSEIGITQEPVLVFNKVDLVSKDKIEAVRDKYSNRQSLFVSAVTGEGLEEVRALIDKL